MKKKKRSPRSTQAEIPKLSRNNHGSGLGSSKPHEPKNHVEDETKRYVSHVRERSTVPGVSVQPEDICPSRSQMPFVPFEKVWIKKGKQAPSVTCWAPK